MRRTDWADRKAELLFDLVRCGVDDQKVIDAIADALREAAGVEKPPSIPKKYTKTSESA